MPEAEYGLLGMPAVLIAVNDDESDAQTPGYIRQLFTITYMVQVAGDVRGEHALIGAGRPSGATSSKGRGLLEVEEEVSRALRHIHETTGVKILARRKSTVGTGIVGELGYVAARNMEIEAKCTDARYYHPPLRVAAASAGGTVTLTWTDPPNRFDRRRIQIRRAAGSTAPANSSSGTLVASVNIGVGTYADTPGVGTWSYSIFGVYTDTGAAADERFSDGPATETGMSVTGVVV